MIYSSQRLICDKMGCASSHQSVQSHDQASVNVVAISEKLVTYSAMELDQMRKEFWESRVDGSPDMYAALRSVCDAILNDDSALADAILQASNITTEGTTLARCYDERGHEYNIPSYCWSSEGPANMIKSKQEVIEPRKKQANIKNANQEIALKVQVNPGDRNFVINANTSDTVAELKTLICQQSTIKTEKNVNTEPVRETRQRMIFMGKELKNSQYLGDVGVDEVRVIQVFLRKE